MGGKTRVTFLSGFGRDIQMYKFLLQLILSIFSQRTLHSGGSLFFALAIA